MIFVDTVLKSNITLKLSNWRSVDWKKMAQWLIFRIFFSEHIGLGELLLLKLFDNFSF